MPEPYRRPRFEFRAAFLRGLAVLLPSLLTLWLLVAVYQFVARNVAEPINGIGRTALAWMSAVAGPERGMFEPTTEAVDAKVEEQRSSRSPLTRAEVVSQLRTGEVQTWWDARWYPRFFGLIVALIGVYLAGRLVAGWLGRRLLRGVESVLGRVPLIRQIYPQIKQIVGFFFSDDASSGQGAENQKMKFSRVVLVQFPRKGVWAIGLMTGSAMRAIENESGEALTVFIPSSPTPFTGWTVTVRRDEVHELPITIDEAIRYLVSGGVLVPPHQEGPARDPLPPTVRTDNATGQPT
jgi:uncharacterized membrane protein